MRPTALNSWHPGTSSKGARDHAEIIVVGDNGHCRCGHGIVHGRHGACRQQRMQGSTQLCGPQGGVVGATAAESSGLNNQMWGTIVDRDGVVCAVAFTGTSRAQWPGIRVIFRPKGEHRERVQPRCSSSRSGGSGQPNWSGAFNGQPLFRGSARRQPVWIAIQQSRRCRRCVRRTFLAHGTATDPLIGSKVGGVNVFGGGLGLYAAGKKIVGARRGERRYLARGPQHCVASPQSPGPRSSLWGSAACRATRRVPTTSFSTSRRTRSEGRETARADSVTRPVSTRRDLAACRRCSRSIDALADTRATRVGQPPGRSNRGPPLTASECGSG